MTKLDRVFLGLFACLSTACAASDSTCKHVRIDERLVPMKVVCATAPGASGSASSSAVAPSGAAPPTGSAAESCEVADCKVACARFFPESTRACGVSAGMLVCALELHRGCGANAGTDLGACDGDDDVAAR
ncbi:MAG: hypothetical protein U0414_12450 [Polyangiaceae bacterium]